MNPTFDPAFAGRDTVALLGPQTAGWQVGFVVYGAYLVLHGQYLSGPSYTKLAREVKVVIWVVFVLVFAYQVLAFIDNFRYMGKSSALPTAFILDRTPEDIIIGWPVDFVASLCAGAVALTVHVFLTIRASVLIRNVRMQCAFLVVMGLAIVASFTGAILTTTTSFMYYNNTINNVNLTFNQSVALWLWAAAFVDVGISLSLFVTLKQRIAGLNTKSDSLVRKLIVVSLQTAAYTSVLAVAGAIVSLVYRDNNPAYALLHFAFWTPLPSCYAISLYTTLAARQTIDEHLGTIHPLSGFAQDPAGAGAAARSSSRHSHGQTTTELSNALVDGIIGRGIESGMVFRPDNGIAQIAPYALMTTLPYRDGTVESSIPPSPGYDRGAWCSDEGGHKARSKPKVATGPFRLHAPALFGVLSEGQSLRKGPSRDDPGSPTSAKGSSPY
ncbi:hypothetical protein JCM10212_005937 [Sporobolomyces blumeae]